MFARIGAVFGGGPVSGAVTVAALAVLIGAGGWTWTRQVPPAARNAAPEVAAMPETGGETAAPETAAPAPAPSETGSATGPAESRAPDLPASPPASEPPVPPSFDVVRIDAEGNALIAGKAAPGADVTVLVDGDKVSAVSADGSGGFVAMFTLPPAGVPRVVSLSMADGDAAAVASGETVILQPAPVVTASADVLDAPGLAEAGPGPVPGPAGLPAIGTDLAMLEAADRPGAAVLSGDILSPPEGAVVEGAGADAADTMVSRTESIGNSAPGAVVIAVATPDVPETGAAPGQPAPIGKPDALVLPGGPDAPAPDTAPALAGQPPHRVDPPATETAPEEGVAEQPDGAAIEVAAADTGGPDMAPAADPDPAPDPATEALPAGGPGPVSAAAAGDGPGAPDSPAVTAPDLPGLTAPPDGGTATLPGADSAPTPAPAAPTVLLADADGIRVLQSGGNRPAPVQSVIIDTISYDPSGEVALGGRGAGGGFIRVYLDNKPIKTTAIGVDGQWRAPLPDVDTGIYTLRVDELSAGGTVTSRTETPFKREEPEVLAALEIARDGGGAGDGAGGGTRTELLTVQPGNTLWGIADDRYGDGMKYVRVFEANRERIRDPHWIYPGQVFALPE